jgi:hypothetical protein
VVAFSSLGEAEGDDLPGVGGAALHRNASQQQ